MNFHSVVQIARVSAETAKRKKEKKVICRFKKTLVWTGIRSLWPRGLQCPQGPILGGAAMADPERASGRDWEEREPMQFYFTKRAPASGRSVAIFWTAFTSSRWVLVCIFRREASCRCDRSVDFNHGSHLRLRHVVRARDRKHHELGYRCHPDQRFLQRAGVFPPCFFQDGSRDSSGHSQLCLPSRYDLGFIFSLHVRAVKFCALSCWCGFSPCILALWMFFLGNLGKLIQWRYLNAQLSLIRVRSSYSVFFIGIHEAQLGHASEISWCTVEMELPQSRLYFWNLTFFV